MAGAELNDDMTSIKEETTTVLTPSGGSLATYAFREAPYVFYRDGQYYFLWSVDDTGSPNYHVAYGTSDSPMGPITVADDPIVIIQDGDNEIYGSAHNSILQIPGTDEWYIVYHRINKAYLNDGPGYHREVCIDRMYFNQDGTIKRVTPTHRGIDPVTVKGLDTGISKKKTKVEGQKEEEISRCYYNLLGQKIGTTLPINAKGVFLEMIEYANGSKRSSKVVVE